MNLSKCIISFFFAIFSVTKFYVYLWNRQCNMDLILLCVVRLQVSFSGYSLSQLEQSYKKESFLAKNIDISWSCYIYYWRTKIKLSSHAQTLTLCFKIIRLSFADKRHWNIRFEVMLFPIFLITLCLPFIVTFYVISPPQVSDQTNILLFFLL